MYDHIGIAVFDLAASVRFYRAVLEPLGYGLCSQDASSASFGPTEQPALWLYAGTGERARGAHLAFRAGSRREVEAFYRAGVGAGGRDNGAPGIRADYGPSYFAAFLVDPDGNNIEAVCLKESD